MEEACVCPAHDATVVVIELYVGNFFVVRARYGDSGGESDLNRVVHGSDYGVRVGLAIYMTKLVSCKDVSLRRCEMMYEPLGVGMSAGGAVAYSDVMLLVDER